MASPHYSAPSSDTSLTYIPVPQVDTQVTLPPIVLPTPPAFAPCLSITGQLTRPAYNFIGNNYSAWASRFELFLESHNLHHHLMEDPRHFATHLMLLGRNQTQPLSLGCFIASSRTLPSLSRASSRRALFGKPLKQCMPIRRTSAMW